MELDVLASGEVTPAPRVLLGHVRAHVELLGGDRPVGRLHPDHLVVAALALAVDAVVEAEDAKGVLLELTAEVAGELHLELVDVGGHRRVDLDLDHVGCPPRSCTNE